MIVLLGYMGSGKSSLADYLNKNNNLTYCDLDHYIEKKEHKSIPEIFKQKGEIYFRKIENLYLSEILVQNRQDVLALGGGTPCYANNMELINTRNSTSIYLKVDLDELTTRLYQQKSERPLIEPITAESQLKDFIRKHLFEREYYYRQAKHIINVTHLSIEDVASTILHLD